MTGLTSRIVWAAAGGVALLPLALPAAATTPPPSAATAPAVLQRIPASVLTNGSTLTYTNLAEILRRAGADSGTDDERVTALAARIVEMDINVPLLFGNQQFQLAEARQEVGFTIFDEAEEASAGQMPGTVIVASVTGIDPAVIEAALKADPKWSARLTTATANGASFFDWGDELNVTGRTPMRPVGIGGQMQVAPRAGGSGSLVVRTTRRTVMDSVATADPAASVWSAGPLAEAFARLGDDVLLQAFGVAGQVRSAAGPFTSVVPTPSATIAGYSGMLAVQVADADAVHAELLIPFETADAAAAAGPVVEQWLASGTSLVRRTPIAEILPGASVTVDGTVVRVSVSAERAYGHLIQMLVTGDLPVA